MDVADSCYLTLGAAHRLFGYSLDRLRELDLQLNSGRTHIIESYPFERDLLIDLPQRLAPHDAFARDALLRDLVPEWQEDLPIRALEGEDWSQPGAFYVHVGTEDSLGSSIPSGASSGRTYLGREEFLYPGSVRIAGRVRMFAMNLPLPDFPSLHVLPHRQPFADLVLPWEHLIRSLPNFRLSAVISDDGNQSCVTSAGSIAISSPSISFNPLPAIP